jgi:hypothetical protein
MYVRQSRYPKIADGGGHERPIELMNNLVRFLAQIYDKFNRGWNPMGYSLQQANNLLN